MSAKSDLKTLVSNEVTLIRNVAYITVTGCTDINDNLEIDESVKYPFCVYGDAVLGSLLAGIETILGAPSSISSFDDDLSDSMVNIYIRLKTMKRQKPLSLSRQNIILKAISTDLISISSQKMVRV